jgi:hypothetical protein
LVEAAVSAGGKQNGCIMGNTRETHLPIISVTAKDYGLSFVYLIED